MATLGNVFFEGHGGVPTTWRRARALWKRSIALGIDKTPNIGNDIGIQTKLNGTPRHKCKPYTPCHATPYIEPTRANP